MKDTFNAFDKDGNAELGYPEYHEAWKFLNRPGSDNEIKNAFDSVDIDESGLVEWNEFVFSMMGEAALKLGPLADLELLDELLTDCSELLEQLRGSLEESKAAAGERKERNAELRSRMEAMKKQNSSVFAKMLSKIGSITGADISKLLSGEQIDKVLRETFKVKIIVMLF